MRLFFVVGRISLCGSEAGGNWNPSRRGEGAAEWTGDRIVLVPSATAGGVPLVLARLVEGLSTHQMRRAARGGLRTVATAAKCHRAPGRLPSGRGSNADRPFDELATSTARRIAAASRQRRHQPGREPVVIERVDSQVENRSQTSCIPSFCQHQITPKTSRYTRCSMSMFPKVSINGRIRSSGQLGRWWYSISPCRNNECVRRFTVFAFNQRS